VLVSTPDGSTFGSTIFALGLSFGAISVESAPCVDKGNPTEEMAAMVITVFDDNR